MPISGTTLCMVMCEDTVTLKQLLSIATIVSWKKKQCFDQERIYAHCISQQKLGSDLWSRWIFRQHENAGSMIPTGPRSRSMGSDPRSIFSDPLTWLKVRSPSLSLDRENVVHFVHMTLNGSVSVSEKIVPFSWTLSISEHWVLEWWRCKNPVLFFFRNSWRNISVMKWPDNDNDCTVLA